MSAAQGEMTPALAPDYADATHGRPGASAARAAELSTSDDGSDDDLDIFDTALSTLFDIPPIGFSSSRGRPHLYTPPDGSGLPLVEVHLASPPADIFSKLQAQNLWLSAVYLADRISTGAIRLEGDVAELGAGAGLPSVIAGLRRKADRALHPARASEGVVLCTDYDDATVVANIRRNAEGAASPIEVRGHSWGEDPKPLLALAPAGFSLLLADTLWSTATHEILLQSVLALLAQDGTVHLTAGLHTGRGPHARFFELARAQGLKVNKVEEVIYDNGEWRSHEEEAAHLEEERGVVIYYTLHR